jgi:2-polyprenyl-6-hydroxyphenyl methylase / 3-demethylubiquinone-9 3-methyltransferase
VLCEPLAELGATMVGADPAEAIINTAELHARMSGLSIDYRCTTAEALANAGETFEVVLAIEVVEHVADSSVFLQVCAKLVSPGGLMILSTINRTFKSFAFAIVAAEYVLRLLPRGAHQWGRFRTPDEIGATMERNGLTVTDVSGVTLNLLSRDLQVSAKTDVNYVLTAERPAAPHAR